jgi:hypothetical protein
VASLLLGCAHPPAPGTKSPVPSLQKTTATTTQATAKTSPILYHRTGGIAGTDDRVVIWPDGVVQVEGRLMPPATRRVREDRFDRLVTMFDGWSDLKDQYLAQGVADAYTITITYGGKTIEAWDLSPDLPDVFRQIFGEIEAIAGEAAATVPPVPDAGP